MWIENFTAENYFLKWRFSCQILLIFRSDVRHFSLKGSVFWNFSWQSKSLQTRYRLSYPRKRALVNLHQKEPKKLMLTFLSASLLTTKVPFWIGPHVPFSKIELYIIDTDNYSSDIIALVKFAVVESTISYSLKMASVKLHSIKNAPKNSIERVLSD